MKPRAFLPLLAAVCLSAYDCTGSTAVTPAEIVMVFEVAEQRVPCQGEMAQRCLRVRAPGTAEWRLFYDPIEGFEHEEGVRYVIEVGRTTVDDPPADGSGYSWRLIRILERERVG